MQDVRTGMFYFDPDDPIYADHFPGYPVVPGSLIIHAFLKAAPAAPKAVEDFRFKTFVRPGRYDYTMAPHPEDAGRIQCRLMDGGRTLATGTLVQ